ncbi:MAG: hypothetical protein ABIZ83_02855 [Casimicrobium sp.]
MFRWHGSIKLQSLANHVVAVGTMPNPVLTERDEQAFECASRLTRQR